MQEFIVNRKNRTPGSGITEGGIEDLIRGTLHTKFIM